MTLLRGREGRPNLYGPFVWKSKAEKKNPENVTLLSVSTASVSVEREGISSSNLSRGPKARNFSTAQDRVGRKKGGSKKKWRRFG